MTITSFLLKRQLDGHTSWNKAFCFPLKFINIYCCCQNVTYAILLNDWQLPMDTFKNLHSSEALLTMWLLSNYFPSNPRYSHNLVSKSVKLDYFLVFCSFCFAIQSINSCNTAISGMQIDHSLSKPQLNHNSTQPNITLGWVRHENDFAYHPTPPHKLNVSNISAVTDPILMKL